MAGHGKKSRESAFIPQPPCCTDCPSAAYARKIWYDEFASDSVTAPEHVEKEWEGSLRNVCSDSVHFRGSENGVLADPSTIQADETPFAEMSKEFNLSDYRAFNTIECLASFAWGQMLNPSASGEQVARYLKSSCSCLSEQSPHTTYEEQAAEALQALRAGNPTKAQMLFSVTVERKHREGKAALRQAA